MASAIRAHGLRPAALDKQIAAEVAELPEDAIRVLLPALREARAELRRDLEQWIGTHADGKERFTAFRYRQALGQLDSALKKISELEPKLADVLEVHGARAAETATGHTVKQLDHYSRIFEGAAYPLPLNEAAAIAQANSFLIPRYHTSAKRYVGKVRDDIRHQLTIGLLRGENFDELTDRLVRLGGPRGLVALRGVKGQIGARVELIAEGLFKRYRYWAERIVRTEVLNAYNTAADASLQQFAVDDSEIKRRWNAAADWRLCVICRELDGQVVAVNEPFKGGYASAPAHPNCRCNIGPWKDHWGVVTAPDSPRRADGSLSTYSALPIEQ